MDARWGRFGVLQEVARAFGREFLGLTNFGPNLAFFGPKFGQNLAFFWPFFLASFGLRIGPLFWPETPLKQGFSPPRQRPKKAKKRTKKGQKTAKFLLMFEECPLPRSPRRPTSRVET